MDSKSHFLLSVVVAVAALALTNPPIPAWTVPVIVVGVGVGIDVDHFLIARWRSGDWGAVRRCLRKPSIVVFDQRAIFEPGEVGAVRRLLSHHVVGGPAVALLWFVSPYAAGLVAASLYVHVLADLVGTARSVVVVPETAPAVTSADRGGTVDTDAAAETGTGATGATDGGAPRADEGN